MRVTGSVAGGPLTLDGRFVGPEIEHADVRWRKPGLGMVTAHVTQGRGDFQAEISSGTSKASAHGTFNWPERSTQGTVEATEFFWNGATLHQIAATFSATPREQRLLVSTAEVQPHAKPSPFDIESSRLELQGLLPRWHSTVEMKFRNGASLNTMGTLYHAETLWRFDWQRLSVIFPGAGTWNAEKPGSLALSNGRLQLRDLNLANGAQSLAIPQAAFHEETLQLALSAHQLDPGPWIALFVPQATTKNGMFNASLQISGTRRHPDVNEVLRRAK